MRATLLLAALPAVLSQTTVPPLTRYDVSSFGAVGNSGWNSCFLNYFLGSDTTVAPNNGVWGAPKDPAGNAKCPTPGPNATTGLCPGGPGTCFINGTCAGPSGCAAWGIAANVSGWFPNTPAPCWANTAPTSYNITPGALSWTGSWPGASSVTYDISDASGNRSVPHFLDYSSILFKDVNGRVQKQNVPPGACLPGNLVNVRTSDVNAFYQATPSVTPTFPAAGVRTSYPNGGNPLYTTSQDLASGAGVTTYTPGTLAASPPSPTGNGQQPPNMGSIRVYFALNYGLRNALDNACDGRNQASTGACVNGGFYVSNLTTALLGDPSKGLGQAKYALIKLCHSPMSTIDRPWRKRSGDAVNNKQCLDVKQLLFGADVEPVNAGAVTALADGSSPMATLGGGAAMLVQPVNAQSSLAVNGGPLVNFTAGTVNGTGFPGPVIAAYTNQLGVPQASPVAFCRPAVDPSSPNGVKYSKALGAAFTNVSDPRMAGTCVMPGTSWKVTKGTNVNLNDPHWYTVDIVFPLDTPKSNYFVRVYALDANFSYLGFGSSATSANLSNTAVQNHFRVDSWAAFKSSGVAGTQSRDIQNGAWGCSLLTVLSGTVWVAWEMHSTRQRKRAALSPMKGEVFQDEVAPAAQS